MFSFLLNVFSTSVYISIGFLVKLYSCLPVLRHPPDKQMKLADLNSDCLLHIIGQLPLKTRLQTIRLVCSHWTKAVESHCFIQKTLVLQLGTADCWKKIIFSTKTNSYTLSCVDKSLTLTVDKLTEELATFLTSTFPRLQTLVVLISDSTEDLTFLSHLPSLISAYAHSLTSLELCWSVKQAPFEAAFNPLITSINCLYGLKSLSFLDVSSSKTLQVPAFDLPLLRTLDSFVFQAAHLNPEFVHLWSPHLQARKQLMSIYFKVCLNQPQILAFSPDIAAHFYSYSQMVKSSSELTNFCTIFTNLRKLTMATVQLEFAETISHLAKLPYLADLILIMTNENNTIQLPHHAQAAPLLTLKHFTFGFINSLTFHHTYLETLNFSEVFPSVEHGNLYLKITHCADCEWKIKANGFDETNVDLMKKCLTKLANLHTKILEIGIYNKKNFLSFEVKRKLTGNGKKELVFINNLTKKHVYDCTNVK